MKKLVYGVIASLAMVNIFSCAERPSKLDKELTGTSWIVDSLRDSAIVEFTKLQNIEATLIFGDSGKLSGFTGCNTFFGNYEVSDALLSLDVQGTTMVACPGDSVDFIYYKALALARQWKIEKDSTLVLADSSNFLLMRLKQLKK